jgi:hypothetical protein
LYSPKVRVREVLESSRLAGALGENEMLESLTLADFVQLPGSKFRVRHGTAESLEFELTEANSTGGQAATASGARQPFSLIFRGPRQPVLPQRIYDLEHDELNAMSIFLVPIGPDEVGMRYEAVFS